MSIIKSLVCAVLFLAPATNAGELFINCVDGSDATPYQSGCTEAITEVLGMLRTCTSLDMTLIGLRRRNLRSREPAEQSKRKVEEVEHDDTGCTFAQDESSSYRWLCCATADNEYSYCGRSPKKNDRNLQEAEDYTHAELVVFSQVCTEEFILLAAGSVDFCFGSPELVFCEAIQISSGD
jgi:hypothetical protein